MDNSVNKYLLDRAIPLGLCEPWQKLMATGDVDKLLALYRKGIDFCLSNDFPSNADLKRLAGTDKLSWSGIRVDDNDVYSLNDSFLVLLGKCNALVEYSGFSASRLFVKHKSQVTVTASGNAYVDIDCFDNTTVNITAVDSATVNVYVYGNAHVIATGLGIRVTHKNKKTY